MVKPNSDQKVLDGIVAGLRCKRATAQLLEKQKGKATPPKAESGKEQATSPGSPGGPNDPDDPDKDKKGAKQSTESQQVNKKVNPLKKIRYTKKVKIQMKQGDYHGFPESVDAFGEKGKISKVKGGDDVWRTKIEISGEYANKKGVFEYIIEPDGITCNHRLCRPNNTI